MEVNIIKTIQKMSSDFMNTLNSYITVIGETTMFFMMFVAIYLCYKKDFAVKYMLFFVLGGLINGGIKNSVKRARPYTHEGVLDIRHTTGYSFPSGHSQNYAIQATTIGTEYFSHSKSKGKKIGLVCGLVIVGLLVAFSRMFLGQHFLSDVLVGLLLGFGLGLLFNFLFNLIPEKSRKLMNCQNVLIAILPVVLIAITIMESLHIGSESIVDMFYTYVAIYFALLIGYTIDNKYIHYKENSVWYIQVLKILFIVLGVVGLHFAFSGIEEVAVRNFYFYFVATLYVSLVLPALFTFVFKSSVKNEPIEENLENETIEENNVELNNETEIVTENNSNKKTKIYKRKKE